MDIKADIYNDLDRSVYLKKIEFNEILTDHTIPYSRRLKKLIDISKELTVLVSTYHTVKSLLPSTEEPDTI